MTFYDQLKFDGSGLIPAIVQEEKTGRVLMMAWMKGETSGHTQTVKNIAFDCDGDTLLIQVAQLGAACHEGYQSCFFRSVQEGGADFKITEAQLKKPGEIYGKKQ